MPGKNIVAIRNLNLRSQINGGQRIGKRGPTIQEMDKIFYEEVHPVLCWNFTVPAGAWGSFDKEHLSKLIIEYKESRSSANAN